MSHSTRRSAPLPGETSRFARRLLSQLTPFGLGICLIGSIAAPPPDAAAEDIAASRSQVEQLIEDLGADSYATRVLATERLQRMGLEAFDALHNAQYHTDVEVEMAARYLV